MGSSSGLAGARALPASVWALGCVSLLMDLSSELIHSLLPAFLVTVLGASMMSVGLIEGVAEATASLTKIVSGALSDRIGTRKPLTVLGYALAAASKIMFPLASAVGWVLAARVVDRIGKGVRGAPRDALIADVTPAPVRGAAYGLRQALDTVGAFLGPLAAIGLMLALADDFRLVFWVAVVPAAAAVAVLVLYVREPDRPRAAARSGDAPLRLAALGRLGGRFWGLIAVATAFGLARFSEAFLILRLQDLGLAIAFLPVVLVTMNAVYAPTAYPAGVLSDRIGRPALLVAGCVVLIGADVVLALAPTVVLALVGVAAWGLHMGLTQGVMSALVSDAAPFDLRGTAFGLFHLVTGITALIASVVAGALWDSFGPAGTFLAGAAFAGLTAAGALLWYGLRRRAGA